jgi:REP element-mobilizing transposase RayT
MARPWRIQFPGAIYHISVRGNNKQAIFLDDTDRKYFLVLLGRAVKRYDLEIFSFCLMDNHYHLFLRTPAPNLSRAMQWLNGTYTGYFNWHHKRVGHLLQGRYKSVLVVDELHYLHLSIYIHLNPVRGHGPQVIEDPAQHEWSSYRDYINKQTRFEWLKREPILANYGAKSSRHRQYRRESLAFIGKKPKFAEQLKSGIIGTREQLRELTRKFKPRGRPEDVPEFISAQKREYPPEIELERVAGVFRIEIEDLLRKRRNFPPRLAAYYHLAENCGMRLSEVGKILNVSTPSISNGIKRFLVKMQNSNELKKKMKELSYK